MSHDESISPPVLSSRPGARDSVFWDVSNPSGYANRTGDYKTRVEMEFIRAHLPEPPARVLDIGAGSGRFALPLAEDGYAMTVNDAHEPSLRLLQNRCHAATLKSVPGDFFSTKVPGSFDGALAIECLDRMPIRKVLQRVRALLNPDGVFVATVLNRRSWRYAGRRILCRRQKDEYVYRYSDLKRLIRDQGFRIAAARGMMWTPFTVTSNSPLVPVCAKVERIARLDRFHSQSPWIMLALRKSA